MSTVDELDGPALAEEDHAASFFLTEPGEMFGQSGPPKLPGDSRFLTFPLEKFPRLAIFLLSVAP